MQVTVKLDTYEKFKTFWEKMADREGYYFVDYMSEFLEDLDDLLIYEEFEEEDENGNDHTYHWKDTIDPEMLKTYYFATDDSWDRGGDVKVRMFIPVSDVVSLESIFEELPKLEKRKNEIGKKYDLAISKQQFELGPTHSEMDEMTELSNKIYFTYGVGVGPYRG